MSEDMPCPRTRARMVGLALIVLTLSLSLIAVSQLTRQANATTTSQHQISTTGDKTLFESSFQNFGFYAQGRYWVFYEDSSVNCEGHGGCLFYMSSTDGASWLTPTNVGIHVTDSDWSIVTNSTHAFYARYGEAYFDHSCNLPILFGIGALNNSGTISWQPEQIVRAANVTENFLNEVVRVDTNGQVWIGYQQNNAEACGGNGIQTPQVIHSNGTDFSTWTGDTTLSTSNSNNWDIDLAMLPGGAVYAAYWINGYDLHGALFNGTWGPDEQISSPSDSTDVNSYVYASGNSVYAIWYDTNRETLRFGTRSSAAQWTINDIGPGEAKSAGNLSRYSLPITTTFDPVKNQFYLYWFNTTNSAIDQWSGFGSSWVNASAVFKTAPASGEYTIGSFYLAGAVGNNHAFGVMWADGPMAPYYLNFGLVTTQTTSPTVGGGGHVYIMAISAMERQVSHEESSRTFMSS